MHNKGAIACKEHKVMQVEVPATFQIVLHPTCAWSTCVAVHPSHLPATASHGPLVVNAAETTTYACASHGPGWRLPITHGAAQANLQTAAAANTGGGHDAMRRPAQRNQAVGDIHASWTRAHLNISKIHTCGSWDRLPWACHCRALRHLAKGVQVVGQHGIVVVACGHIKLAIRTNPYPAAV